MENKILDFNRLLLYSYGHYVIATVHRRAENGKADQLEVYLRTKDKKKALAYKRYLEAQGISPLMLGSKDNITESFTPSETAEMFRKLYNL